MNLRLEEILALSVRDRLKLLRAIAESLEADSEMIGLTAAQERELDRRWRKYLLNPSAAIPLEDVLSEIRTRMAALTSLPKPRRTSTKR